MSNNINLQQQEYNFIDSQVKKLHSSVVKELNKNCKDLRKIIKNKNGCFYIEALNPKIEALIDSLDHDIVELLEEAFDANLESVDTLVKTIENCDTIC
ncbi:hypothetical protein [Listeria ilorinensis]|uniref:hypothetical protein n=1 Tax=Listeria ilorinensis TaxID=2867439 RepID=UPI001EF612F6|nr:hypothetical protein [Listeria ilorinensis]